MSEIITTEALVLTKIDFGDSSNIVSLFTKEMGIIPAIVKGGKTGKSGKSRIIDPPNYLKITIYNKSGREVQIVSEVDIISHYSRIKEDYDKLKYSYAVIELIKKLLPEHEPNQKIFRGIIRVLELLETPEELPEVIFGRFFMFILKETGYELSIETCSSCSRIINTGDGLTYNYEMGILCGECGSGHLNSYSFDAELFYYLTCLKSKITVKNPGDRVPSAAINFMESFLKFHIPGFQGIQTFQIFK